MSITTVLLEAVVVAIALAVLFMGVHAAHMAYDKQVSMQHRGIFAQVAISGALFHVGCEILGVNKWYCETQFPDTR